MIEDEKIRDNSSRYGVTGYSCWGLFLQSVFWGEMGNWSTFARHPMHWHGCVVLFVLFFNKEKMFMFMSQCQTKLSGI